jgi:hypothetical protein
MWKYWDLNSCSTTKLVRGSTGIWIHVQQRSTYSFHHPILLVPSLIYSHSHWSFLNCTDTFVWHLLSIWRDLICKYSRIVFFHLSEVFFFDIPQGSFSINKWLSSFFFLFSTSPAYYMILGSHSIYTINKNNKLIASIYWELSMH